MEIQRLQLLEDRDAVIVMCHGKRRADRMYRVVIVRHGARYTRILAPDVLENLYRGPATGTELAFCKDLLAELGKEYKKERRRVAA